ncbi:MAG TPA: aminotransferase class IV [Gemmataceae bacterium]|jgi:branched-chain amino acid aminotransferase
MVLPLTYLNGQFLPQAEVQLPLHDAGFVFGATATDLCRTFHHRFFRLSDHLVRFRQSCALARIPQPVPDAQLTHLAEKLVAHNALLLKPEDDLALVLFATPGPIGYYGGVPGGPGDGPPTLGMHTFALPFVRYRSFFERGVSLVVPPTRHVPASCFDPRAKVRSRLHWWLAEQEAREIEPGAVALLLNHEGGVTETAGANVLIVKGGTVVSPPRSSILNGISLQVVEELCREEGIPFQETVFHVEDCLAADEALLTSTPYCVAGVSRFNGRPVPWPGPVWKRLLSAWGNHVGLDIAGQILAQR